ncbi:hypothetical protein FNV43_RR19430 [Rhamnella rubrinervis]|uniref:Uncharacterized protein n=1 Tax=Rhamnella rubrinervis TaxID=2594499 RepID=A0A8K0DYI9_9ROSA|nr:hypothetical protein FNV43_RR19430 [Rhamnella rubrinervis]
MTSCLGLPGFLWHAKCFPAHYTFIWPSAASSDLLTSKSPIRFLRKLTSSDLPAASYDLPLSAVPQPSGRPLTSRPSSLQPSSGSYGLRRQTRPFSSFLRPARGLPDLPTPSYGLPTASYGLSTAFYSLPTASYGLPTTIPQLPMACHQLPTAFQQVPTAFR